MEPRTSHDYRELGDLAVWSVSSAKPGNGVDTLRDGKQDTFWQSDGVQPHLVNIQFQKKMLLAELHLYVDCKLDESYTPNKISIRAGSDYHDLKEIKVVDLEEPSGWIVVPLGSEGQQAALVKAYLLQLAVLSNHQNGRDTHVREVKVFGPRVDPFRPLGFPCAVTSTQLAMYSTVR